MTATMLYQLMPRYYRLAEALAAGKCLKQYASQHGLSWSYVYCSCSHLRTALHLTYIPEQELGWHIQKLFEANAIQCIPRSFHPKPTSYCGRVDAERWERIFNERFADPDYYSRECMIRMSSPLACL